MTASDSIGCRTVSFSILMFGVCWICSLPRTFNALSKLGAASALFTFISVLLATIFAGIESHPAGYDPRPSYTNAAGETVTAGNPIVTAIPVLGTTFVSGLSAFLNISYTFIGQITLPSFIAEMKDPRYACKYLVRLNVPKLTLDAGSFPRPFGQLQLPRSSSSASLAPLFTHTPVTNI